jgi:glycerol-3-phosphate dehydrogenase
MLRCEQVRQEDILSVWSGIRPLAHDPTVEAGGTAGISRDHLIFSEPDGLITITGELVNELQQMPRVDVVTWLMVLVVRLLCTGLGWSH